MADLSAPNGIIHEVDAVIASPIVVTHALANPDFSTLVAALTRTGLITDFVSVLSVEGPFTVIAPTSTAFVVHAKYPPITLHWDHNRFYGIKCLQAATITTHTMGITFNEWFEMEEAVSEYSVSLSTIHLPLHCR